MLSLIPNKSCCLIKTQIWKIDESSSVELLNPSFENFLNGQNPPGVGGLGIINDQNIEGWSSIPQGVIEVWGSGFLGVPSYAGDHHIEMNANVAGRLFQRILVPNGLGILKWQVAHRARGNVNAINTAEVIVGLVNPDNSVDDNIVETMVSPSTSWTVYSGTYAKPCGYTEVELAFNAVSPTGGIGNFLDDVRLEYQKYFVTPEIAYQDCCGKIYEDAQGTIELDPETFTLANPNCFSDTGTLVTQSEVLDLINNNADTTFDTIRDSAGNIRITNV